MVCLRGASDGDLLEWARSAKRGWWCLYLYLYLPFAAVIHKIHLDLSSNLVICVRGPGLPQGAGALYNW